MQFRRLFLCALACLIPAATMAMLQDPATLPDIPVNDPIAHLQRKLDSGDLKLSFDEDHGYLTSLLKALKIPVSSQTLVFSKSSFQLHLISPAAPRALYFNDDVYIGWVMGGSLIEVASVDPKLGPLFYTLDQQPSEKPKFVRETNQCLICHDSSRSVSPVPRLLVLSVVPNTDGNAVGAAAVLTNDQSPFRERWGGWYVSGTHGSQYHLGNMMIRSNASAPMNVKQFAMTADLSAGANVTDLNKRFDATPYLSRHSDIVALTVLAHQTHVHNLIALASYEVREAEAQDSQTLTGLVENVAEPLVQSMLFSGAATFTEPIADTSGFFEEFPASGPRDNQGRSLRDLDMKTRLLRYPLSYLIYSDSFNEMPALIKDYVYRRLGEVLTGKDTSDKFSHLSDGDREAILGILKDTKPDFTEALKR